MGAEWRGLSSRAGLAVDDTSVKVTFRDQRRQTITIDPEVDGSIRLWTVVAWPAEMRKLASPFLMAWRRNRLSELVGFAIDRRGRLVGEAFVPAKSLSLDEWEFQVRSVAEASDRLQYLLTGKDQ
jgi:hypothetical protein